MGNDGSEQTEQQRRLAEQRLFNLTPDLKPFYAVTYLPKEQWMEMTRNIGAAWQRQSQTPALAAA